VEWWLSGAVDAGRWKIGVQYMQIFSYADEKRLLYNIVLFFFIPLTLNLL
jgi:hypothetical protein